jgi:hypothetical protein
MQGGKRSGIQENPWRTGAQNSSLKTGVMSQQQEVEANPTQYV